MKKLNEILCNVADAVGRFLVKAGFAAASSMCCSPCEKADILPEDKPVAKPALKAAAHRP